MPQITSAGILPTSVYNKERYYYFGVEKKKGVEQLSTFGGKLNRGEKRQRGAAREFMEESLGAFVKKKEIKKILKEYKKNKTKRIQNTQRSHVMYIAPVPVSSPSKPINKFHKLRKNPKLPAHCKEVKKIVAVKASTLRAALQANKLILNGYKVRSCVANSLKLAHARGAL